MIISHHGETQINGKLYELMFEFDEIMRMMIANHPDIVQASILLYADDLATAEIDGEHYVVIEELLRKKHEMQDKGGYDDSGI